MCWGCECGDGWFDILYDLCKKIEAINPPEDFKFCQVKEKMGGLRVYTVGCPEEVDRLVDEAQRVSYKTCEECGTQKDVISDWVSGWVRTICKSCAVNNFGPDIEKLWNPTEPSSD